MQTTDIPFFPADQLLPGDILLMLGTSPLSDVIAWAGDSIYSHGALVTDNNELIEAALSGVRRYSVADRMVDHENFHFIDAYRPLSHDGQPIDVEGILQVLARADDYLKTPYPADQLTELGIIFAVRGKWPSHPVGRLLVRAAMDRLVKSDPSKVVCTELIYRAFSECNVDPKGSLSPRILIQPRCDTPFPDFDWEEFYEEMRHILFPESNTKLYAAAPGDCSDEALEILAAQVRQAMDTRHAPSTVKSTPTRVSGVVDLEIPNPNPRLISPLDLASTPSHILLGRVMDRA